MNLSTVQNICNSRGLNSDPSKLTCPHCLKQLDVPGVVFRNIEAYHQSSVIAAPCCGKPVRVSGQLKFSVAQTVTSAEEDNWGVPFKQ